MRLAHFGTFDVENFGDLLFPLLLERRLGEAGFEFVHVSPAGGPPVWRDCVRTVSTSSVLENPAGYAAAVVGGGNIVHAAPTTLDTYGRGEASAAVAYPALWVGAAYVAACNDAPLCWNAPSVAQAFSPPGAKLARWAASLADYLAVRDPFSVTWLREAGVARAAHVVPDTALELSALWPRASLGDEYAAAFARRGREVPERTVCFHLNSRFVGTDLDALAARLDRVCQRHGHTPVLLATGPCHGESELARAAGAKMSTRPLVVDRPHGLREMASLLAHADGYVGSSLHGMIVACSYGRRGMVVMPRVNAPVERVLGFVDAFGLSRWLVPTWEDAGREAGDFFAAPLSQWEWALQAGAPLLDEHWARMRAALAPAAAPLGRAKRAALEQLPAAAGGGATALLCGVLLADHAARGMAALRELEAERAAADGRERAAAEALGRAAAEVQERWAAEAREAWSAAAAWEELARERQSRADAEAALRRELADASARAAELAAALGEADAREYALQVRRLRHAAGLAIPEGATVAVVSKGDDELLRLGDRRCRHFPVGDDGEYAGHHPADDAEAVEQVERARRLGAAFLLFPSSAAWWLEHYRGLAEHLRQYPVAHRDTDVVIFSLAASPPAPPAPTPPAPPDTAAEKEKAYRELVVRLRDVVRAAAPPDATVLVVSKGDDALLALDGRRAFHFPRGAGGGYAGHHPRDSAEAIDHLERSRPPRGGYLLLPAPYFWWLDHYADFARHLDENHETAWRDDACVLYALRPKGRAAALRRWVSRLGRRDSRAAAAVPAPARAAPRPATTLVPPAASRANDWPQDRLRASLVTVVVPVYNAYEETRACLASLVRHGRWPHRVLLIDDHSTDERIWPLLRAYATAHEHVVAVQNEANLGFTATVNRGCALAPGDVVLLNSDTEATADWLEKLAACAAGAPNVGTVTALSNAAGAFSVPVNNADNDIPAPLTADDVAAAVERLSRWVRPTVPTGNGFCMYVTRRALREVGPFDQSNFPRGYGEENDFCRRCAAAGLVNLIDDRTFIRHKGTASFLGSKAEHLSRGLATLRRLHPGYDELVQQWLRNDPLDELRADVAEALAATAESGGQMFEPDSVSGQTCLLFVVHDGAGGTLHMVEDLIRSLSADPALRCLLLKTGTDAWTLFESVGGTLKPSRRYGFTESWRLDRALDAERVGVLRDVVRQFRVALAHVHHLIGSGAELVHTLKEFRLPVVFSFHDFYALCPTIQLLDDRGRFCGGRCTGGAGDCRLAANLFHGPAPRLKDHYVHEHRGRIAEALRRCDAFVAPSHDTRTLLAGALPFLDDGRFEVIEHGVGVRPRDAAGSNGNGQDGNGRGSNGHDASGHDDFPAASPPGAAGRVRVLCLGNLNRSKGTDLILQVMRLDRESGRRFEFHFLGLKESGFDPEALGGVYHGAYERSDLPALVRRIRPSVAVIASIWPETYCYTLTEAWALGLPVVASNLGALRERIGRHGGGWLADPTDASAWYRAMTDAIDTPGEWEKQARRAADVATRPVEDMAADYVQLYGRLLGRTQPAERRRRLPLGVVSAGEG